MAIEIADHSKPRVPIRHAIDVREDGIVDLYHHGDSLGFEEKGPLAAIEEFLTHNSHFVIDSSRERYLLTYNPKGFLKRIS